GRYADAADVLKPLLAHLTATLGANHAETFEVRRRIASLNLSAGRLDEAEKDYAAYASDAALERLEPAERVYLLNARAAIAGKRGEAGTACRGAPVARTDARARPRRARPRPPRHAPVLRRPAAQPAGQHGRARRAQRARARLGAPRGRPLGGPAHPPAAPLAV